MEKKNACSMETNFSFLMHTHAQETKLSDYLIYKSSHPSYLHKDHNWFDEYVCL